MLDIGNLSEWHRQDGPVRAHPACAIRTDSRCPASNQRPSAQIRVPISFLWLRHRRRCTLQIRVQFPSLGYGTEIGLPVARFGVKFPLLNDGRRAA